MTKPAKYLIVMSAVGLVACGLVSYIYRDDPQLEEDQCLEVLKAIHAAKDRYWSDHSELNADETILWNDLQPYLGKEANVDTPAPERCIYLLKPLCVDPSCVRHGELLLKRADPMWISENVNRGLYLDAERWNSQETESK